MLDNDDDFQDIGSEIENVEEVTIKNVFQHILLQVIFTIREGES